MFEIAMAVFLAVFNLAALAFGYRTGFQDGKAESFREEMWRSDGR